MATALQKQLATIQATRKNELDLKAQKAAHAKSLLFDAKVAAGQSFDVIYQLCREGFQDLCTLDPRFARFATSLFSPTSKDQDRDLMTEKENADLDNVIENFLGLLGARVLLKPAQEAAEWLIRRFQVHERNSEALILTFISYHAHPIFLTLLSILPSKLPPSLRFLYRYANTFSNPPRDALVQAAVRNPSFFSALNTYVLKVSRNGFHYPVLISLWASVVAQSVDIQLHDSKSGMSGVQKQRAEDILTNILPVLNEALALKSAAELVVGCHMILIVLVGKLDLDDFALDAIMSAVALSITDDARDTALACLSVLAERKSASILPKPVLKTLLPMTDLTQALENISKEQSVRKLVLGLAYGFTTRMIEQAMPEAPPFFALVARSSILPQEEKLAIAHAISEELSHMQIEPAFVAERKQLEQISFELHSSLSYSSSVITAQSASDPPSSIASDSAVANVNGQDRYVSVLEYVAREKGINLKEENEQDHDKSFLVRSESPLFEYLALVFEAASPSPQHIENFTSLPIFRSTSSQPSISLFTFLARFWSSHFSVASRSTALKLATERLNAMREAPLDMQLIIPYALSALADSASNVRAKAAGFVTCLSRLNVVGTSPWGQSAHNGHAAGSRDWLSAQDSISFVKQGLIPALEECLADSNHIGIVVRQAFEKQAKEKILKSKQKPAIFKFLSVAALHNEGKIFKYRILQLLNNIADVAGTSRSDYLLQCLKDFVAQYPHFKASCTDENLDISMLTSEMVRVVSPGSDGAVNYLCSLATEDAYGASVEIQDAAFQRLQTIWTRISPKILTSVIAALMNSALSKQSTTSRQLQAATILKNVPIAPKTLKPLIEEALANDGAKTSPMPTKKRRINQNAEAVSVQRESEDNLYLNKLTLVMEVVEASKISNNLELFQSMFKALQELQSYGVQTASDLAYLTSLALSCLTKNMRLLNGDSESRRSALASIRPDLLVDCIRNTSSPQNRTSALLILSFLATHAPQSVLQSVMPIFTMMSATTVRLSDEFSAHVVDQTVKDVMPVLVLKLQEEKKELVAATSEILRSFAAAFDHIPPHRRLRLFKLLASSLGAKETLFAIITAIVDAYPGNDQVGKFTTTLCRQFGCPIAMTTVSNILHLISQALNPKPSRPGLFQKLTQENAQVGDKERTMQNLMQNVLDLLADPLFQQELQSDLSYDDLSPGLEESLGASFETIFTIFNQSQPSMKQKSAQVLEHLLLLFPFESMARSVQPLLSHPDESICRSLLGTLEAKIRASRQANKAAKVAILGLLPSLTAMLQDEKRSKLRQNVLSCIDQICENFGKTNTAAVLDTMRVVAGQQCLENANPQIQIVSLYCLASSLEVLSDDFIPLLKPVEKAACASLTTSLTTDNENLHNAATAFFMSLTDSIPYMISEDCLHTLLTLSQQSAVSNFSHDAHLGRSQMLTLFAKKLELSTMARLLTRFWPEAARKGAVVLQDFIDMCVALVDSHSKSDVSQHARELFGFFLEALDLRYKTTSESSEFPQSDVEKTEQSIIGALLALVLKLNDTLFRPFFVQLLEWSSTSVSKKDTATRSLRTITLFNLVLTLSERLKSIFTPYFAYVLERAGECLQNTSSTVVLRKSILDALTSSFKHDSDDFWQSPSRFDPIIEGLAAQFTPPTLQRLQPDLLEAFTELGVAASSNEHHRDMNGRLLKLLRSDSARVRLAAVKCQQGLSERLGDEWLSNLPEMLPFINELQEDDDEEVERETQRWIKLIEEKLGESLNTMLQ